jgi:hypothetical protein
MKKRLLAYIVFVGVLLTSKANAQDSIPQKYWKFTSVYGLNITQSAFVNWAAGGRNSISALGYVNLKLDYAKNKWSWQNSLDLALGGMMYFDDKSIKKTDDKIDFSSNLGYKLKDSKWYASLNLGFRTQSLNGYVYPNDSVRVSSFMAPAYTILALGIEYKPNDNFGIMLSPVTGKFTVVNDQFLADQGAYGVRAAQYDANNIRTVMGKRFRPEIGAYLNLHYDQEIAKNIFMKSKLQLFSNYLHNPQNIDVNAEIMFTFKINNWFTASLQLNGIYDDDIKITTTNKKGITSRGPRTQFKQVLGLGIQYTFKNFKDEPKK